MTGILYSLARFSVRFVGLGVWSAVARGGSRPRWRFGLGGLVVAGSLAVTGLVGTGAAAPRPPAVCAGANVPAFTASADTALSDFADVSSVGAGAVLAPAGGAVAARAGGGAVTVLAPRAGAVIVAGSAAGAHRLRGAALLSITRRVRGLGLRLNGHPLHLPARLGRMRVRLDAADGLVVGENFLWVTVGGHDGHPVVPFVVGYRDTRAFAVHLRLGPGALSAATLSLRVPLNGIDSILVTLNGVPVRVPSSGGPTGRIGLDLPEVGPVHWGTNHVAVRLVMLDGRVDDWARTFRLHPRQDVAIAELHGRSVVGRTVTLDASRSLIVPSERQHHRVCWVLLRRPRLSHARLGRPQGTRITLRPDVPGYYRVALFIRGGSRPAGREASVAASGLGGYDVATVAARYDEPLVPVNTIVYPNGVPGVQVEHDFYPDPSTDPKSGAPPGLVQVLVLDRNTLEYLDSETLNSASAFQSLAGYLQGLPSTDLAIVTHPVSLGSLPSDGLSSLDAGLRKIGGSLPAKWTLSTPHCWSGATDQCGKNLPSPYTTPAAVWQNGGFNGGSFSVIGVPGLQVGQAWRATAAQTGTSDGRIAGYLTRGNTGGTSPGLSDYTVINGGPDQYGSVDTCSNDPGHPQPCSVRIGSTVTGTVTAGSTTITDVSPRLNTSAPSTIEGPGVPSSVIVASGPSTLTLSQPATASATNVALTVNSYYDPGPNGFHVVILDRTTLAPILNQTVTSAPDLLNALTAAGGQQGVGHFVGSMNDQRLVIIQTVGNGFLTGLSGSGVAPLFQYTDELGGTPDLLAEAMTGYYKYALVGAAINLPWRNASALESSTEIPAHPSSPNTPGGATTQTGQLSGVLQRDPTGLYTPAGGDPMAKTNPELNQILYQPAQPWPYADDTQDLQYIATKLGLGYSDVRSAYYENTNADWSILRSELTNPSDPHYVTCPPQDVCGPGSTFENLRGELADEFEWVGQVQKFAANLRAPYDTYYEGHISQDVTNVKNTVNASKSIPPAAKAKFDWASAAWDVMYIASGIASLKDANVASAVFGLIGSAGGLATGVMATVTQDNGAPAPADTLTTTADNLNNELLDQVQAYDFWVNATMEPIVLRDYGKLQEVGSATLTPPWALNDAEATYAGEALRANTRASAYSALIPTVWAAYNLKYDNFFYGQQPVRSTDPFIQCDSNSDSGTKNHHHVPWGNNVTLPNQFYWTPRRPVNTPQPQFRALTSLDNNGGVYQAWAFSRVNNNDTPVYTTAGWGVTVPSTDLTHYIYGANSTDGDYGAYQFAPVWWRNTYNPPSYTQCYGIPSGDSGYNYNSTAYPPPNIPPPPP